MRITGNPIRGIRLGGINAWSQGSNVVLTFRTLLSSSSAIEIFHNLDINVFNNSKVVTERLGTRKQKPWKPWTRLFSVAVIGQDYIISGVQSTWITSSSYNALVCCISRITTHTHIHQIETNLNGSNQRNQVL